MAESEPTIFGGWLGTYDFHSRLRPPVSFEATFTASGDPGVFGGSIVDDGPLGRCGVQHGLQTGRHVRFTRLGPVPDHFQGTISEDGGTASGSWERKTRRSGRVVRTAGRWEARRLWSED